jgi:hypothetical protein
MRNLDSGECEHCGKQFGYYLIHSGFNDTCYAYCTDCGMTAELSVYSKEMPQLPSDCDPFREICVELEPHIQSCMCGGTFKKGASPRCPHCKQRLSAEAATIYIERNAPGTKGGWAWQKHWHDLYCIVIENRFVTNNFKT